jgi:hypothetical protein
MCANLTGEEQLLLGTLTSSPSKRDELDSETATEEKECLVGGGPRQWQMEDAVCTAVPVPDREPQKGWSGRGVLAGNMGNTLPRPGGTKARARAAGPKSRALETDASRLNRRCHGASGSSAVFLPWRIEK